MSKKINTIPDDSELLIDTGYIYTVITQKWYKYPRELFGELEFNLEHLLTRAKIVTVPWNGDLKYFEDQIKKLDAREEKIEENLNVAPFLKYFVTAESEGYSLTAFNSSYILKIDSDPDHFNFFFALNLITLDPIKIHYFLEFHLKETFKNSVKDYKIFLSGLLVKYIDLLKIWRIDIICSEYIQNIGVIETPKVLNSPGGLRKVLALYYLFEEIDWEDRTRDARIRFISYVTGLSINYVDKLLKNPLQNKSTFKGQQEDFEEILHYFRDLKLKKSTNMITSDLKSLDITKKK